jgi:hypothetical protein
MGEGNLRWPLRVTEQKPEKLAFLSPLGAGERIKVRGFSDCRFTAQAEFLVAPQRWVNSPAGLPNPNRIGVMPGF